MVLVEGGDDTINSGDGDDRNVGDNLGQFDTATITGDGGDDKINSGKGNDINNGGTGNDKIKGRTRVTIPSMVAMEMTR